MATYVPQDTEGSATGTDLSPVGVTDSGGVARRLGAVLKSGLYRLLGRVEIESAGGNVVTSSTDGSKERLDGSVKLRNPGDTVDIGDAANPVRMDPTGSTVQPISATALPLPAGAATEATLGTRLADSTFTGRIGEVQASPTTYTVLERLKVVYDVLALIKDTDGVKKITDPLPAGTNNIGDVDVASSALPAGAATETTLAAVETLVTAGNVDLAAIEVILTAIRDTAGIKKITDALPTGTNVLGSMKIRGGATAVDAEVSTDALDGRNKLWIQGAVSMTAPPVPEAATPVIIRGNDPLDMTGTEDSTPYVIPNGETYTLTQILGGAEGDTTERGTAIEAYYDPNGGGDELIARIYVTGFSEAISFSLDETEDGTPMVGNVGGTNTVFLRRRRLSGGSLEVDATLNGYVE